MPTFKIHTLQPMLIEAADLDTALEIARQAASASVRASVPEYALSAVANGKALLGQTSGSTITVYKQMIEQLSNAREQNERALNLLSGPQQGMQGLASLHLGNAIVHLGSVLDQLLHTLDEQARR